MATYKSGATTIHIDQYEPAAGGIAHPALLLLHGSGGAAGYWMDRIAPMLLRTGVATYAPHYFNKTGTQRAAPEIILDGRHFPAWLEAIRDAVSYIATRPAVDARRIAVLGVSLGGYLAIALSVEDARIRAVVELSGGAPSEWDTRITAAMPPTLILHGAQDHTVPVSEAHKLEQMLSRSGVTHEMEIFPNETHWFSAAAQARLLMHCGAFLGRYL